MSGLLTKLKRHGIKKSFFLAVKKVERLTNSVYWRYKIKKGTALRCPFFVIPSFRNKLYFFDAGAGDIVAQADQFVYKKFSMLGADFTFDFSDPLCWHTDYRLKKLFPQKDCYFNKISFCHDSGIVCGKIEQLEKDIKVPWELSRLQFLPVLALAYMQTGKSHYYGTCRDYIVSWNTHNPCMCGINWVGPMEVALRVINLIWTYQLLHEPLFYDDLVQLQMHQMIYEHMTYLENHWEVYDGRTNNHYLSDLVGYLYCLWFFQSVDGYKQNFLYYFDLFCSELQKQVLPDGALYEGSTAYHRFVLELCEHVIFLARECNHELPETFVCLYQKMKRFAAFCQSGAGLVKIGDDDSGFVLWHTCAGSVIEQISSFEHYFKDFGLSVYKNAKTHVTLRHHAYTDRQPTGHFHNDVLSVSLVHNGVPLLVDPGSYVYTASIVERNYFRSVRNHSTVSINNHEHDHHEHDYHEQAPLSEGPFFLGLSENMLYEHDQLFCAQYAYHEVTVTRRVQCDDMRVCIVDTCKPVDENNNYTVSWTFVCGLGVDIVCTGDGGYLFIYNKRVHTKLMSDVPLMIESCWVSTQYGVKKKSVCLRCARECFSTQRFEFTFDLMG